MNLLGVLMLCVGGVRADSLPLVSHGVMVRMTAGAGVDDRRAPALLRRELLRRVPGATATPVVEPGVRFGFTHRFDVGPEGFELFIHDGKVEVIGYTDLSLCYAAGEILRHCHVRNRTVTLDLELNPWLSRPLFPLRAVQWDPVEGPEYGRWDLGRLRRWLDELILWGLNAMIVPLRAHWGDLDNAKNVDDARSPAVKTRRWERFDRVIALARVRGLQIGVAMPTNGVFPERLRRQPILRATPAPGGEPPAAPLACPTRTQGRLAILKTWTTLFRRVPQLDYLYVSPLSDSGCWCRDCRKRGWAEVYLDLAKRLKSAAAQTHPHVNLLLSDRGFVGETNLAGEEEKLLQAVTTVEHARDWIDFFAVTNPALRLPEKGINPFRFGYLTADPFHSDEFGATPLLRTLPGQWRRLLDAGPRYRGFVMTTSGIHDWFNVLAALRWHWSPRRTPENLAEFITRYCFGDEAAGRLVPLVLALDHGISGWSPYERIAGGKATARRREAALTAARKRRRHLQGVAALLPEEVRHHALFRSLEKRVAKEARFLAVAASPGTGR